MKVIYKIVNKTTKRYYVGGTLNFKRRIDFHKSTLKRNKHGIQKFQNDWNKYGESDFEVIVVKQLPDHFSKRDVLREEQPYLDIAKTEDTYNKVFTSLKNKNRKQKSKKTLIIDETLIQELKNLKSIFASGYNYWKS